MVPSAGLMAVMTLILWLGCSCDGRSVMERANVDVTTNSSIPTSSSPNGSPTLNSGTSSGKVIGIVVGSVAGGVLFAVILGLLIRCLCLRRRKVSSNQEKPGSNSVPNGPKPPPRSGSVWSFFPPKRDPKLARPQVVSSKRVPVPIFHSDKLDDVEFSDHSFVLPELGGPNPHNKFDGMPWVDIKGMDDDVLVEISTDLRKYQQHQRQ